MWGAVYTVSDLLLIGGESNGLYLKMEEKTDLRLC